MHVVGDGAHVVEKLRVDRPPLVLAEDFRADELIAMFGDRILEQKLLPFEQAEAEPFVPHASFVGRFGRAREPAFVDPPSVGSECVKIIGMKFDAAARMQEAARHPSRGQAEQAFAGIESLLQNPCHVV